VKSASDLLNNTRLFDYAMTAFGLGAQLDSKGLMKKVLQQGVTSGSALANTLNNPNILAFAKAFDFAGKGSATTSSSTFVNTVVNRYVENALETNQGQQNPGVELALYFKQNAPKLTSVYGILADKNLLTVVQTALGISPYTSAEPIDTQYAMLSKQIKLADFQDPKKLQAFISRFAAMYDLNSDSAAGGANYTGSNAPNALLLDGAQTGLGMVGFDTNLLSQVANLQSGG
jgi:hypothetical protein